MPQRCTLVFQASTVILAQAKLLLASQHFGLVLRCLRGNATFGQKGNKQANDTLRAELAFG